MSSFLLRLLFGVMSLFALAIPSKAVENDSIDQFDVWRARYAVAAPDQKAPLLAEGIRLAKDRRAVMKELVRQNPRYAIERAISSADRRHLPEPVAGLVETWVSAQADIMMQPAGSPMAGVSADGLARVVRVGTNVFAATVYGVRLVDQNFVKAPIQGLVIDDLMAIMESPVRRLAREEVSNLAMTAGQVVAQVGAETKIFDSENQVTQTERNLMYPCGLRMPTAETMAVLKSVPRIDRVRPNALGFARLNERRRAKGLTALTETEANVAPMGEELILEGAPSPAPTADASMASSPSVQSVNGAVDNSLSTNFPPIRNQGGLNSCASFATTYYQMTYMTAMARGWDAKNGGDAYRLSPKWTYNAINGGSDGGSDLTDALSLGRDNGMATWAEIPYDGAEYMTWMWDPSVWRNAIGRRMNNYYAIGSLYASNGLANLKAVLDNGYVVTFGSYAPWPNYTGWEKGAVGNDSSTTNDDAYVGQEICKYVRAVGIGHAMTVVGYNDDLWVDLNGNGIVDSGEKGALKIANSWGNWANGGYAWFAYDALKTSSGVTNWNPSDKVYGFGTGDDPGLCQCFVTTAKAAYNPTMLARFTINHPKRCKMVMMVGKDGTNVTANPATTWRGTTLSIGAGGPYAFDGSTTACDGTFYLDMTGLNPDFSSLTRYFVGMQSYNDSYPPAEYVGMMKSVTLVDVVNAKELTVTPAADPGSFNPPTGLAVGSTAWAYLDYSTNTPRVVMDSTAIVAESCTPTNGAIDPGELVTVNFTLRNTGGGSTGHLTATLMNSNGVSACSGPQDYGMIAPGATVTRSFSLSISNAYFSTAPVFFQLQDDAGYSGKASISFVLGHLNVVMAENCDGVTAPSLPSGWTTSSAGPLSPWLTSIAACDTVPNAAYGAGTNAYPTGESSLSSPQVSIVNSNTTLSFRHSFNTYAANDGGVLEIKIGTSAYTDIVTAGGIFMTGGYNGALTIGFFDPLGARPAWTGNSGGFQTTTVLVPPSAVGKTVQFCWRSGYGYMKMVTNPGWTVDTVSLTYGIARDRSITTDVSSLTFAEGSNATFRVRLPDQPSGVTTVMVARVSGDAGISAANGGVVVFDSGNWATWQPVTVLAASDVNQTNSSAVLQCSAPGYLSSCAVSVLGLDSDVYPPGCVNASDGLFKDRVSLSWNSATNAQWYEVWRSTSPSTATAVRVASALVATNWTDTTVLAGTNYCYRVKAGNSAAISDFSETDMGYSWPAYLKWGYAMQLRFTGYNRSESLTNFPVLVMVGTNMPGFDYGQMVSPTDAGDLRFMDASQTAFLNHEPDLWATGGVSAVWVQVPVLTNNASIWMVWGNPLRKTPPACTTNGAVWDATFRGVWHMTEPTGTVYDSTANRNNGTRAGTVPGTGQVGGAQVFSSAGNQQIDCGNQVSLQSLTNLTLSLWIKPTALTGERGLASKWSSDWCWVLNHDGADVAGRQGLWFNGWHTAATAAPTGQWSHVAVSYSLSASTKYFYLNGSPDGTAAQATGPGTGANLRFGTRQDGGGSYFDGSMDEIRVESVSRSTNWMWACYMTMASNQAFMSWSAPVTNLMTLTVSSPMTSIPAAGTYAYPYGQSVTGCVTAPLIAGGVRDDAQWQLIPYEGGARSGIASNVVVQMTNDMTLAWSWLESYLFTTTTNPAKGIVSTVPVDAGSWCPSGMVVTVTATPTNYYHFVDWVGDVLPNQTSSNPVTLVMTQPRTITGVFAETVATNGVPQWWLAQYGWTNNFDVWALQDSDTDGMTNWQEYIAGTDPNNSGSLLIIDNAVGEASGDHVLTWPGVTDRLYSIERSTNLMDAGFDVIVSNLPGMYPVNAYTDSISGIRLFYRIKASKVP